MKRIRVVEVVGNSEGGGARIVAALIAALDASRFTATLVAPASAWLAAVCAQSGARFQPLPLLASRVGSGTTRDLRACLADARPDIVHAHGTRAATYVARCMPRRGAAPGGPAFLYSEHLFSFDARRGPLRLPWYALERSLCRRADAVTTSCRTNAERLVAWGWLDRSRIALETYGIALDTIRAQVAHPLARAELGVPADAPLVGTVARMVPQKGLPILLDAVPQVLAAMPDAWFVLVGDGPLRPRLEAHAARLGVSERVRFMGSHTEPWRLLAHADVIALPSLFEGLPLTALEALAAGRAVVTTRVGGNPDVVLPGHTGLLVPPRQPAALAQGILTLLRDPAARLAMGRAGQDLVRSYDLSRTLDQFAGLYAMLAAHHMPTDVSVVAARAAISTQGPVELPEDTHG